MFSIKASVLEVNSTAPSSTSWNIVLNSWSMVSQCRIALPTASKTFTRFPIASHTYQSSTQTVHISAIIFNQPLFRPFSQ
jgi:hypothetical protein